MKAVLLLLLLLAGCMTVPKPTARLRIVHYELAPGFMGNRGYDLVVASNGAGRLRRSFRANGGWPDRDTAFRAAPAQIAAFEGVLASYRPKGTKRFDSTTICPSSSGDDPLLQVHWSGGGEPQSHLAFDTGCAAEAGAEWASRLLEAPRLLGLKDLP